MKLNLKKKTFLVFGIVLLLSSFIASTGYYTIVEVCDLIDYKKAYEDLKVNLLQARRNEKDFVTRDSKSEEVLSGTEESKYFTKFSKNIKSSLAIIEELKKNDLSEDFGHLDSIAFIEKELVKYNGLMDSLFNGFKERGFKSVGIEGELRNAIHNVEHSSIQYDKAGMLMLRRHEKDFFLRSDKKYLENFEKDFEKLKSSVAVLESNGDSSNF